MAPSISSNGTLLLSEKEQRLAALMILSMEDNPKVYPTACRCSTSRALTFAQINYKRVAELGGYTEGSARTLVTMLKRKLKSLAEDEPILEPKASQTGGRGKRKAVDKSALVDDDEELLTTPLKKLKAMTPDLMKDEADTKVKEEAEID